MTESNTSGERGAKLVTAILERYGGYEVPRGDVNGLAKEFNLTTQRVYQIISRKEPVKARYNSVENRRTIILSQLEQEFPNKEMPPGTLSKLGLEHGISRERVRQIASAAGYRIVHVPSVKYCSECPNELPVWNISGLCRECYQKAHVTTMICHTCGTEFKLHTSDVKARARRRNDNASHWFCTRKCWGVYCGKNYGWGRKSKEKLALADTVG